MKSKICMILFAAFFTVLPNVYADSTPSKISKPDAETVMNLMKAGNERFCSGKMLHGNQDASRIALAAASDQGNYAVATVLSCSDSRVPVELIFDSGIMELFVVRVAGNVCNTDEAGCIEYGVCHVKTPLLLVLGHSKCGAVSAVMASVKGHGHESEKNIPPLVASIKAPVERAIASNQNLDSKDLMNLAIEENVYESIYNLLLKSAAVRAKVLKGELLIAGGLYDLDSGRVIWFDQERIKTLTVKAEQDPRRSVSVYEEILK